MYSICIHPSNKVALSVGADNKLIMWNLIKGCKSTTRKLTDNPIKILFNADGSRYAILYYSSVKVYNISDGQEAFAIENRAGFNDMVFMEVIGTGWVIMGRIRTW